MELNDIHTEHEHASVSLKVLLLVFALVLIGALSYMVMVSNNAADTAVDYTVPSVKKTVTEAETANGTEEAAPVTEEQTATADETAGWKTFSSDICNFSLKYPSAWTVEESNPMNGGRLSVLVKEVNAREYAVSVNCFDSIHDDIHNTKNISDLEEYVNELYSNTSFGKLLGKTTLKDGTVGFEAVDYGATNYYSAHFLSQGRYYRVIGNKEVQSRSDLTATQQSIINSISFAKN